jgi:hypothetical protein
MTQEIVKTLLIWLAVAAAKRLLRHLFGKGRK